jgi:Rieske Fe-S protein
MPSDKISRRTLGGLAAAGVSVPLLAACAADPDSGPSGSTGSTPSGAGSPAAGGGKALTQTADIEVGGGQIFADQEVVVTQPTAGEFKCFTAVCTHQGCLVSSVSDGTINCDCHGSHYSIENGDVEQGPATFPLGEVPITVSGDSISLA